MIPLIKRLFTREFWVSDDPIYTEIDEELDNA